jgi:hypothetical protein
MFAIFKNDSLLNFWGNKPSEIFIQATCRGLKLNEGEIDLNFYFGIDSVPAFYEFDQDKKLIVKKEIITINEVVTQNELGEEVVSQEEIKTYEVEKIIEPIVYFAKGVTVKPC